MKRFLFLIVFLFSGAVVQAAASPPTIPGYRAVGEIVRSGTRGGARYVEVQSLLQSDSNKSFLILRSMNIGTGDQPSQNNTEVLGTVTVGHSVDGHLITGTYRVNVDGATRQAAQDYAQARLEQAQSSMGGQARSQMLKVPAGYWVISTTRGSTPPVIRTDELAKNFDGANERAKLFADQMAANDRRILEAQGEVMRQVDGLTVSLREEALNRQLGAFEALGDLAAEAGHFEKQLQQAIDTSTRLKDLPKTEFQYATPEAREKLAHSASESMAARDYMSAASALLDIYSPLSKDAAAPGLKSDGYVDGQGVMRGPVFSPGEISLKGTAAEMHAQLETANYLQAAALQSPHLLSTPEFRDWMAASYYQLRAGNVDLARAIAHGFSPLKGVVRLDIRRNPDGSVQMIPGQGVSFSGIIGDADLAQAARRSGVEAVLAGQPVLRGPRSFANLAGDEKKSAQFLDRAFARISPPGLLRKNAAAVGEGLLSVAEGNSDLAQESLKCAELILDVALGFVPVVGTARDIYEAVTGTSLVTGEKLSNAQRLLAVAGVVTLGVVTDIERGAKILKGVAGVLKTEKGLANAIVDAEKLITRVGPDLTREAVDGLRRYEELSQGVIARSLEKTPDTALALGVQVSKMSPDFARDLAQFQKSSKLDDASVAVVAHAQEGVSKYMTRDAFNTYVAKTGKIAGSGGSNDVFVLPKVWANSLDSVAKGKASVYAEKIGLELKAIENQELVRIDLPFSFGQNPRLPSGAEAGANRFFKEGGFTSGGIPEIVIDAQTVTSEVVIQTLGILK